MLKFGAGHLEINNEVGRFVQAAGHEKRAVAIRDDLEANALFLTDDATNLLLISCDLAALEDEFVKPCCEYIAEQSGIDRSDIIIACSHTHGGPCLLPTNRRTPVDEEYLQRLRVRLTELSCSAVQSAAPCSIAIGRGTAAIGFNRRCCWEDGSHTMHGNTELREFTGLEGPEDHDHTAVFVRNESGDLAAILHHNTSHPTAFYGSDVYSADFPGAARAWLREALNEDLPVLFLNGAQGDISMEDQMSPSKGNDTRDQKVARSGHLMAAETLRLLHGAEFQDSLKLAHTHGALDLEVSRPEPERLAWARRTLARFDKGEQMSGMDRIIAHGVALLDERCPAGSEQAVTMHAFQIGGLAMATQPFELFCQFGLDIKRRSPFPMTAVVGVADGFHGYCPTTYGSIGGGYSGEPIYWTRYLPDAGYRVVDKASELLWKLWHQD
ncbi:MAG: hypothetical protein QF473_39755 [Planctomycetota bacterium]|nr:hypothetical protein [Planctomycetota bacterium]